MSASLAYCMVTVFIGLSFALMAFLLLRVALLTSPAEKVGRNIFRALPGVFFAAFAMYIVSVAVSELPEDRGQTPVAETSPPLPAGLPLVVGQVVVTRLPEFAFIHSNGSGSVELKTIPTQPSPNYSDNEDSPSETTPVPSNRLVPVADAQPWRQNVVRTERAGPNGAIP
ncbi:MAG: hypothetical protein V3V75_01035 [Thermoguttaceae bacterium]